MKRRKGSELDFIIDQLTSSIQHVVIGMKSKKKELSVDYMGGQEPLTLVEEQELHEYFKKQKANSKKVKTKGTAKKTKQPKVVV